MKFYFDFVSPYSYIAWTQIHALAARHRREVEPIPVALGAILSAIGTRGPAEIPAKRAYLIKETYRIAHALGLPLYPPPAHPFNSLLGLRIASLPMAASTRRALIDRLFAATWAGQPGITDKEEVGRMAAEIGLWATAVADAETPESKARVKAQTDECLAAGGYGVPTIVVERELFFGYDSFPHIDRFLSGDDPVRPELTEWWAKVPVGVERRHDK